MSAAVAERQPSDGAITPAQMLAVAVQQGADLAKLEKLMELQERWERNQARKAFDAAMAAAKAEIKPIAKNRQVDFSTARGRTNYSYEDFAQVAATVDPALSRHGLSYRFRSKQEGKTLTVVCVLCHQDGHCEETSLVAPNDESGNKNAIQSVGSAATYLQRYTLKLALGLAAGVDDDAQGHGRHRPAEANGQHEADVPEHPSANGNGVGQPALAMLHRELTAGIKELARHRNATPGELGQTILEAINTRFKVERRGARDCTPGELQWACDSLQKALTDARAKAAEQPVASPAPDREPGMDPEPEEDGSEVPPEHGDPVGKQEPATPAEPVRESKLPKQVIDQVFAELKDAGVTWRDLLTASEKVIGRKLAPNARATDLTIRDGAAVIDWCKRTKAERAKAKAAEAAA